MDKTMEECLSYFRGKKAYGILFQKFREKYEGLGYFGGSVTLTGLSGKEKEQLEGFFQKSLTEQEKITITAGQMKRALKSSRFWELEWKDILEAWFQDPMKIKKEEQEEYLKEQEDFFKPFVTDSPFGQWLSHVLADRGEGIRPILLRYRENKASLKESLLLTERAAGRLPSLHGKNMRLPLFAAEITGNPHYFDEGSLAERLLTLFIKETYLVKREEGLSEPEWKKLLLFQAGILKDDLSNDILAYGIHAKTRSHELHEGIESFCRLKEPIKLTLFTLSKLEAAWPWQNNRNVYVLENPSVFSALTEKRPFGTFVCTNGQPRLSALVLLDLLSKNARLCYAGDFDPEGLAIAGRLKERYGEKLEFWGYKREYYDKIVSNVFLNPARLRKLDSIKAEGLLEIKEALLDKKLAAYQEALLELCYLKELPLGVTAK